jgi:hypothetical protein
MKLYLLTELFNLSHDELFSVRQENAADFDRHPIGSPELGISQANMRLIHRVLGGARPPPC